MVHFQSIRRDFIIHFVFLRWIQMIESYMFRPLINTLTSSLGTRHVKTWGKNLLQWQLFEKAILAAKEIGIFLGVKLDFCHTTQKLIHRVWNRLWRGHGIDHVLQNFFMWPFLTSRFDHVYYGNCLEDTKSDMDLEPLFQFVAAPIDQRSTPAEQVRSKEAYGIIKKWANDPNGFIICCDQKKWHANVHPALSSTHCGNVVASTMWQ